MLVVVVVVVRRIACAPYEKSLQARRILLIFFLSRTVVLLLQTYSRRVGREQQENKTSVLGTGEYHTADQVLGCAEACQRLAVCPLATLELGCNTSCILACAPAPATGH